MRLRVLALLLSILPFSAGAQVYADFQTSLGNFTCELHAKAVPMTVANFVTLAEGTRPWLDERTGLVSGTSPAQPFYDGTTFHRVVDQGNFRVIQAGSRKGDGSDGPGYTFPDEFDETIPESYNHDQPYLLSMANTGVNSNGSQFFITGTADPSFDGKNTVFGRVVSGQTVVEAILGVATDPNEKPLDPVVIRHVSIRRVGTEAKGFTGQQAGLPVVSAPEFTSTIKGGADSATLSFIQPPGSLLRVWTSQNDGATWEDSGHRFIGSDESSLPSVDLDLDRTDASQDVRFRIEVTTYPATYIPGNLANTQLYLENESGEYLFRFNGAGDSTYMIVLPSGDTKVGTIKQLSYQPDGYGATVLVDTGADGAYRYRVVPNAKSRSGTLTGSQAGSFCNLLFGWLPYEDNMDFALSALPQ